ncbi:MAG: hypothetical protein WDA26_04625 [Pusillimonas sp.]
MVYHIAMLQDLEFLEARVGKLVELARQLQSRHDVLAQRVAVVEQERDALLEQLVQQESEYKDVAAQANRHRAEMDALRAHSESALQQLRQQSEQTETRLRAAAATEVASLKEQLERQQAEQEAVRQRLHASQSESSRLRQVAEAARERIDAVLIRLPGAPQE